MLNQATSGEVQNFVGVHPTDFKEGDTEAAKDSMLKEFGHFDPRIVKIMSYVAMPAYVGWGKKLLTYHAARLRTSSVGHSMFLSPCLGGRTAESFLLVMLPIQCVNISELIESSDHG